MNVAFAPMIALCYHFHAWSARALRQLQAQSCLGLHKDIRETLCPKGGRCAKSDRDAGDTLQPRAVWGWWSTGGAGGYLGWCWHMGCCLCAMLWREFCVGFRDCLWFQGKHNQKERRAWQLHVSWDSCMGKLFPFTLVGLQAGPDPALMKTIPRKSSAFFWLTHGFAIFSSESDRQHWAYVRKCTCVCQLLYIRAHTEREALRCETHHPWKSLGKRW